MNLVKLNSRKLHFTMCQKDIWCSEFKTEWGARWSFSFLCARSRGRGECNAADGGITEIFGVWVNVLDIFWIGRIARRPRRIFAAKLAVSLNNFANILKQWNETVWFSRTNRTKDLSFITLKDQPPVATSCCFHMWSLPLSKKQQWYYVCRQSRALKIDQQVGSLELITSCTMIVFEKQVGRTMAGPDKRGEQKAGPV